MHALFDSIIHSLVLIASELGYFGVFIGMFLESTIIPIPSELIMIPAGISAAQGGMNIYILTFVGILGNVLGAIFSYFISISLGRTILLKFGRYFLVKEKTIIKIENFFQTYGGASVFIARLLPGFRHFISIPAGIAKMNFAKFTFYTTAGSAIWTSILAYLGFFIGENQELIGQYVHRIILISALLCIGVLGIYYFKKKK